MADNWWTAKEERSHKGKSVDAPLADSERTELEYLRKEITRLLEEKKDCDGRGMEANQEN